MTKPQHPAQDSRKPTINSQTGEERKLRSEPGRESARGIPASALLMGLAGSALAASGRLSDAQANSAAQHAGLEPSQELLQPGLAGEVSLALPVQADVPQAASIDVQALEQIVSDLVVEALALPGAHLGVVPAAAPIEAAVEAALDGAAAQAAQVAADAAVSAVDVSQPVMLAQASVPAASGSAASSSAAAAASTGASAAAGSAAAAAGTAAAAATVSTTALLAVGAVLVGVAASGGSGGNGPEVEEKKPAPDTAAPTLAITDDRSTTTNGAITYTFTFSEAVTGFTAADVTVANGTKGTFTAVSGTVYTLVVTPTAGFEGNVTVDVAAGAASDAAGNASTAAAQSVQAVDTKASTVAITDDRATTTNGNITYTFTFSEAATGFTADDVTVANGTKGSFTAVSSTVYTLVVTPTAGFEGNVTVDVAAGAAADAASNASTAATQSVQAVDTKAPTFVRLEAHSNGGTEPGTIDLIYNEPMSGASLPPASAFVVSINGTQATATGVAVDGSKVTLTFAAGVIVAGNLNLTITYADPTAGDDVAAVQDAAGNDAVSLDISSGVVADGYIRGAQMYLDGPEGPVELAGVVTDDFGNFFLPAGSNPNNYPLVAVGGVNIDTGLPNTTPLKAPAGSTTINPLTTLVQAVIQQAQDQGQVLDAATAASNVAQALGLTLPEGESLTSYDPLSATDDGAVQAQKAAAQVATLAALAAEAQSDAQAAADATASVLSNLATVISNAVSAAGDESVQAVSLSDTSVLTQALDGVTVSEAAQVNIVEASTAIAKAATVDAISNVQSQFVDGKAPDAPTSLTVAAVTKDTTPSVVVRLNVTSTDGGAAVKGDTLVLLDGTTEVGRVELTQAHIDAGRVEIDTAQLSEGAHQISAKITDKAGNTGLTSAARAVSIDVTAPQASLTSATDNLASGASTTLTLTFGETVTGLTLSDLQVTGGGVLSNLSGPQSLGGQQVYTVTYTAPAAGGAGSVQLAAASVKDAAGNDGISSNAVNLAAVNPPVVSITGVGGADRVVSGQVGDNVVRGAALAAFGDVTLKAGETTLGTATADGGRWSYTLTSDNLALLAQGADKTITATQTRTVGGNDYTGSASATFAVDTAAPAGLAIDAVSGGAINAGERTSGVAITGTAEAGSRVQLTVGGITKTVSAENGIWSYTLTSADYRALGEIANAKVTATAVDAAGNASAPVERSFAIDTTAPILGLLRLTEADDSGTKADGRTSDRQPVIEFSAEKDAILTVELNSGSGFAPLGTSSTALGGPQTLAISPTDLTDGTYVVRLTAQDDAGNTAVRTATVVVDSTLATFTSANQAAAIAENSGANQLVYTAAATDASALTYSLKAGVADQSAFTINASTGQVRLVANPNFEAKSSYGFTVVAKDAADNISEKAVTLSVQDVNEAPTAVALTTALNGNRIDENTSTSARIKVADVVITDDALGTETVTLTGADAAAFEVEGGVLYLKAGTSLNHEAKSSYAVTVNVVDTALSGSTPLAASYALTVADVNEAPTALALSATAVAENGAANATVATLSATDPDGAATNFAGPFTFALVSGAGDTDNGKFTIDGANLKLTNPANFEAQQSYGLRLQVTDKSGLTHEVQQTITVGDVNEAPTAPQSILPPFIATNAPYSFNLATLISDPDAGDTLTYAVSPQAALPAGLTLASNGLISGAVAAAGQTSVTVTATDPDGLFVSRTFTLTAVDAPAFSALTADKPLVTAGNAFTLTATLTEPVNVAGGTPTLTLNVGGQDVVATYSGPTNTSTSTLTFTAIAPATGDSSSVKVSAFSLGEATIIGGTSGRPLTSPVDVTVAQFTVDNTAPSFQDGATVTKTFAENGTGAVHGALVTDATAISYILGGADGSKFNVGANGALTFKNENAPDFEQPGSAASSNSYVVEVTATDAVGLSSKQTVTINVTNVNDNPVVLSDANGGANTVVQNAAVGTAVGITALGTDADSLATVQYSLSNDAAGRFAIDPVTGVVTLAKAGALDHQTSPIHKITVLATSSDGSTNSLVDLEIAVTPIPIATVVYSKPANIDALFEAAILTDGATALITSTLITATSADGTSQLRMLGTGLTWTEAAGGGFQPTGGMITRIEFDSGALGQTRTLAATLDGLNLSVVALSNAIDAAGEGDDSQLNALFSSFREDVTGSTGNDTLGGDQWNDTIKGGDGNDMLVGSPGDDSLDGGNPAVSGNDLVDYRGAPGAVTVNLKTGVATTGAWGTDSLTGIEGVLGSTFNDSLVGSDSTTVEDFFVGGLGNDTIDGGAGFDIVSYDWDNTQAVNVDLSTGIATGTGVGTDTLINIEGVIGSSQADNLKGGAGDDWFRPQGGNDTVDGGAGNDRVNYDRASGAVTVNLTTGTSSGANGVDTLINIENLRGSAHADTLTGNAGNNDIQGRDGNDTISGLDGNDSLNGEIGNDSLLGGNGADTLIGGAGDDTLDGGAQLTIEDNANFSNEFDVASYSAATAGVTVNLAAGTATGAAGNDVLNDIEYVVGSNFNDSITGSDRRVVEIFRANKGNDTIQGGTVNDQGTNLVDYRDAAGGGVNVNLATGSVTGADGTDTLVGAFHGVIGSADVDTLTGGGGDDFLDGRLGDDIIDGGGGNDRVAYNTASGGVNVNLAAGTATGAAGNDVLTSIEYARGSEHADTLIGSDIANDLQGRAGDDNIQGGGGNDTIHGGMGNDTIDGGEGQDLARFSGLFSPDRYGVAIATNGVVTITDTLAGGDGIDTLSNIERFEFSDGRYKVNAGGTGLVADVTSLDDLNPAGTAQAPQVFNSSSGAFNLTDDATRTNYTVIEGYGADDTLRFLGLPSAELLSIGNVGSDVELLVNNDGVTSTVILSGVVTDQQTLIYDIASFNALPVGDLLNIFQN
jgi:Ca2+-binding RTX toxin-like protein